STFALARSAFVVEAVPPLTLKGKSEPVAVYRVLGPERRASPRGGPKIVGRETELAQLYAYYREAIAGRGQLVHVHGEAGVGETRLRPTSSAQSSRLCRRFGACSSALRANRPTSPGRRK